MASLKWFICYHTAASYIMLYYIMLYYIILLYYIIYYIILYYIILYYIILYYIISARSSQSVKLHKYVELLTCETWAHHTRLTFFSCTISLCAVLLSEIS